MVSEQETGSDLNRQTESAITPEQWEAYEQLKQERDGHLSSLSDAKKLAYMNVVNRYAQYLRQEYPDFADYLLYHLLAMSTPQKALTHQFDFPHQEVGKYLQYLQAVFRPKEEVPAPTAPRKVEEVAPTEEANQP